MTQKDKELLLKDLSAKLPYGVKLKHIPSGENTTLEMISCLSIDGNIHDLIENFRPYLRPMSSMTEEEVDEFTQFDVYAKGEYVMSNYETIDWLNAHHFDYRGLIEKGLALEAPEDIYK